MSFCNHDKELSPGMVAFYKNIGVDAFIASFTDKKKILKTCTDINIRDKREYDAAEGEAAKEVASDE